MGKILNIDGVKTFKQILHEVLEEVEKDGSELHVYNVKSFEELNNIKNEFNELKIPKGSIVNNIIYLEDDPLIYLYFPQ